MSQLLMKAQLVCAFLFVFFLAQAVQGQGPNRPGAPRTQKPNRPGRPGVITPTPPPPNVVLKKGDLLLYTSPIASNVEVSLTRARQAGVGYGSGVIKVRTNQDGFVQFHSLAQGKYEVLVTHEDYEPFRESVVISSSKPITLPAKMFPKFGDVTLFISPQSVQPGPDIRVALDGELIPPDKLQYRKNEIVIPRVPVGIHRSIQVVKHGYKEWNQLEFDVKPRNIEATVLPVELKPETIALTIKTEPEANVYRINQEGSLESLGNVPANRELLISGLLPGTLKLRVTREGYENAERLVTLTLDDRSPRVSIELEPKVETSGGTENFVPEINNWYPERPLEWKMEEGNRRMLIRGDKLALFTGPRKEGHPFGYHGDFELMLMLKLINGKGASWVVRALDEKNYYRFDLTPDNKIAFSVCRNGQQGKECKEIQAFDVIIDRTQPDNILKVILQVEGNRFKHLFTQSSRPSVKPTELGVGGFADEAFKVGGVGMCAIEGAEFYLYQFTVEVKKR